MNKNRPFVFGLYCCLFAVLIFSTGCPDPNTNSHTDGGTVYQFPRWTDENYRENLKSGIVLLDFYADWCGPCRMMDPHLAKLHDKWGDKITIAKIDVDRNPKACEIFEIRSIPVFFVFVNGEQIRKAEGYQDEKQLFALVEDLIEKAGIQPNTAEEPIENDKENIE